MTSTITTFSALRAFNASNAKALEALVQDNQTAVSRLQILTDPTLCAGYSLVDPTGEIRFYALPTHTSTNIIGTLSNDINAIAPYATPSFDTFFLAIVTTANARSFSLPTGNNCPTTVSAPGEPILPTKPLWTLPPTGHLLQILTRLPSLQPYQFFALGPTVSTLLLAIC